MKQSGAREHHILDTLALALYLNGHAWEALRIQTRAVEMAPEEEEYVKRLLLFRAAVRRN